MKSSFCKIYVLIILELLQSCGDLLSDSKNIMIIEKSNSEKSHKLSFFVKEGGATVGNSYHISALTVNEEITDMDVGNVFIADDHDGAIPDDTSRVKFRWIHNDTATIAFDHRLRVFKMEAKINGLIILYDTTSLKH